MTLLHSAHVVAIVLQVSIDNMRIDITGVHEALRRLVVSRSQEISQRRGVFAFFSRSIASILRPSSQLHAN